MFQTSLGTGMDYIGARQDLSFRPMDRPFIVTKVK